MAFLGLFYAASPLVSPNATLPDGSPGFNLVGKDPGPQGLPAVQFLIGFNNSKPPSPNAPLLDLTKPPNPNTNSPDSGPAFGIFWGMLVPGLQFTLPTDSVGGFLSPSSCSPDRASLCYDFAAANAGAARQFDIFFMITSPTGTGVTGWSVDTNPVSSGLPAVQFNFNFSGRAGDPTLAFSVTENANPLNFSVPEPGTLALVGLAVAGALASRRRRH